MGKRESALEWMDIRKPPEGGRPIQRFIIPRREPASACIEAETLNLESVMDTIARVSLVTAAGLLALPLLVLPASACHNGGDDPKGCDGGGGGGDDTTTEPVQEDTVWMHSDVGLAHGSVTGLGSRITVIDDFTSDNFYKGRLRDTDADANLDGQLDMESFRHGEWTRLQTQIVAPDAGSDWLDFNDDTKKYLTSDLFDVVNLSYGLMARASFASYYNDIANFPEPHESMLYAVKGDKTFAAKAAGNDSGAAVGETVKGTVDVLAQQFIQIIDGWSPVTGSPVAPVIFVGALEWNPDSGVTEGIASYSSVAGTDPNVQNHFLVVGVEAGRSDTDAFANYGSDKCGSVDGTCLYGTSFAAPVVAGYGALLGQKFSNPNPSQIADVLLSSAVKTTISNYDPAVHGMGEACLSCALGPVTLK